MGTILCRFFIQTYWQVAEKQGIEIVEFISLAKGLLSKRAFWQDNHGALWTEPTAEVDFHAQLPR